MKRVLALAAAMFAAVPAFADEGSPAGYAGDSGPYVALRAGAVFLNEEDIPGLLEFNTGFGVLASGGYAFAQGFRLEGEAGYRRLTSDSPFLGLEETDSIFTFFAN